MVTHRQPGLVEQSTHCIDLFQQLLGSVPGPPSISHTVLFFTYSQFVSTCACVAFLVLELEFFIKGSAELCPGLPGKKK